MRYNNNIRQRVRFSKKKIQITIVSATKAQISINTHTSKKEKERRRENATRPLAVGERSTSFIFPSIQLPFVAIVCILMASALH